MIDSSILFNPRNKVGCDEGWYKPGDTVYVHPEIRRCSKGYVVTDEMVEYAGRKAKVTSGHKAYHIDIDNACHTWDDYMLMSEEDFYQFNSPLKGIDELLK